MIFWRYYETLVNDPGKVFKTFGLNRGFCVKSSPFLLGATIKPKLQMYVEKYPDFFFNWTFIAIY